MRPANHGFTVWRSDEAHLDRRVAHARRADSSQSVSSGLDARPGWCSVPPSQPAPTATIRLAAIAAHRIHERARRSRPPTLARSSRSMRARSRSGVRLGRQVAQQTAHRPRRLAAAAGIPDTTSSALLELGALASPTARRRHRRRPSLHRSGSPCSLLPRRPRSSAASFSRARARPRHDGADRQIEHRRDVLVGKVLDLAQHAGPRATSTGRAAKRRRNLAPPVAGQRALLGIGTVGGAFLDGSSSGRRSAAAAGSRSLQVLRTMRSSQGRASSPRKAWK